MAIFINTIVALMALLVVLYLLKKDLGLFLLSYVIIIQYIWMFFSLIVIESGIYINEQERSGYFVYSSIILFLFFSSTVVSLIFFKRIFTRFFDKEKIIRFKFLKINEDKLSIIIIFIVLMMAFLNIFSSPIPLFSKEVTKFNFWEYAKYPFLKSVVGNVMGFVAFGSTLLYYRFRKTSIFFLLLYVTYLLLVGQKFTGFLIGTYGVLLAFYYSSNNKIEFNLKWIFNKYVLIVGVALFYLILNKYTLKNPFKYLGLTPVESIFYRTFGLQAHVFWGVVERYVYLGMPNTWDISELWKGMHHLMLEFWPGSLKDYISVTTRGVSWTNAYPSILVRIFPLSIALVVNFFLISFVALIQSMLSVFIRRKSFLISIILFQILTWVSYAYTMAYFYKLVVPFIFLIIYFGYKYLIYYGKKTNRL